MAFSKKQRNSVTTIAGPVNEGPAIKLEGRLIIPSQVEGENQDVYSSPRFILLKSRWMQDDEARACVLCDQRFGQLNRKHHCRMCGRIVCNKCCNEKMPLPQLALCEPERVCEWCRPLATLVRNSRAGQFQFDSAKSLARLTRDPAEINKVVELGGVQSLVALSRVENQEIMAHVMSGLQALITHQPLQDYLVDAGAIKAICTILSRTNENEARTIADGMSSLMLLCKMSTLRVKALQSGVLPQVMRFCGGNDSAIGLLALRTLSLLVEHASCHDDVVQDSGNTLAKIIQHTVSGDEQMQHISLNVLAHLSTGTEWNRRRIIQEDFSSGQCIARLLQASPSNRQVLCHLLCLIANLATCAQDQSVLRDLVPAIALNLSSDVPAIQTHAVRAIANFAQFKENMLVIVPTIADVVRHCLSSSVAVVRRHACQILIYALTHNTNRTAIEIQATDGSMDILKALIQIDGMSESIHGVLATTVTRIVTPLS